MEKVLRINVGAENGPVATIEELGAYAGLGGRAMTTTVVYNEVPPNCHPLGPENKLIFFSRPDGWFGCGVVGPHLGRMQKPAYGDHQGIQLGRHRRPVHGPPWLCGHHH